MPNAIFIAEVMDVVNLLKVYRHYTETIINQVIQVNLSLRFPTCRWQMSWRKHSWWLEQGLPQEIMVVGREWNFNLWSPGFNSRALKPLSHTAGFEQKTKTSLSLIFGPTGISGPVRNVSAAFWFIQNWLNYVWT